MVIGAAHCVKISAARRLTVRLAGSTIPFGARIRLQMEIWVE